MKATPKGARLHIGLFGRRNTGKSSLLNALTRQNVSIVSDVAGTTTDPVEKPMELLPLGPVLFIDTAGIDDEGALGAKRAAATRQVFRRTDIGLVVGRADRWGPFEKALLEELRGHGAVPVAVLNMIDLAPPAEALLAELRAAGVPAVATAAAFGRGLDELRGALLAAAPEGFLEQPALIRDLLKPGELAVLVVPVDLEAPRGRLILPQAQAIRDLLDGDSCCLVVKERGLAAALGRLSRPPALVVTDSQAFAEVAAATPPGVPLTSFSILFSRYRGDLFSQAAGAFAIARLKPGDRILVAEACTHHPIGDDIGRVKLPRLLERAAGGELAFTHVQGHDFPEELSPFALVIHCGACMLNRREVLGRIQAAGGQGVPVTNYGLAIAFALGILPRALGPFPEVLSRLREAGFLGAPAP